MDRVPRARQPSELDQGFFLLVPSCGQASCACLAGCGRQTFQHRLGLLKG